MTGKMWPAIAAVPWHCWAAEGDGFQSSRVNGQLGSLAMLARHWNILLALGLPTPPSCDWLRPCLIEPSITLAPAAADDGDAADEGEEEEDSEEGEGDEEGEEGGEEESEEEVEEEEAGPSSKKRLRR